MSMIALYFSYNRLGQVQRTLPTVAEQCARENIQLFIWDNASRDGCAEHLKEFVGGYSPGCYLVLSERNLGKAAATNEIMRRLGGHHTHFISIDDDARPGDNCLRTLKHFALGLGDVCGMISPVFEQPDTGMPNERYETRTFGNHFRLRIGPPVSGACFVTSTTFFRGIGGYPETDLPVYGREDGWLCGIAAGKTHRDRLNAHRSLVGGYLENCTVDHQLDKNNAYAEFKHRMTFDPNWRTKREGFFET